MNPCASTFGDNVTMQSASNRFRMHAFRKLRFQSIAAGDQRQA